MKNLFYAAVGALLLTACSQSGYVITGSVDNADLNGKTVYLYPFEYATKEAEPINSAVVENGAFTLEGVKDTPLLAVLRFDDDAVKPSGSFPGVNSPYTATFVLENGRLKADLSENPSVTGTPENDALTALQKEINAIRGEGNAEVEKLKADGKAENDAVNEVYGNMNDKVGEATKKYIANNADKLTSAKLLLDNRYNFDEDVRRAIVDKAGSVFKSAPGIDRIIDQLAVLEKVGIGKKFTDFEMKTPDGKDIKLSDNVGQGKIVLIDFWASWCPPCRADIPHLIEVYKQYKEKGFEIVGVSLDRTNDDWIKGIDELHITWPQMSDLKFWQSEGATLYGVNSIPHTVLVDKDGTIIAKNLRGQSLDDKLAEVFK